MGISGNFSRITLTKANNWCRWQIELFFKCIKQHLKIKSYYCTSENAIKTQIRNSISWYVWVTNVKNMLKIASSLYTILHILSVTLFEKEPPLQVLINANYINTTFLPSNRLVYINNVGTALISQVDLMHVLL